MSKEKPAFIELPLSTTKLKYTEQEKIYHCEAWKKSGKSMRAYCEGTGIAISSFSEWANKQSKALNIAEEKPNLENVGQLPQLMEIVLTSGLKIRFSKTSVPELLRLIKGLESCS